ncbi:hypothetical protein NPIL_515881 [Nephila pilipes]|uniref:Uncharacterized protein n=1 Tax=Nephila pilipes TaxID=299642 RepID=A0A8X6N8E9_NEPPI|nr:hypothetical protein NPIL_515881 [Nephila pilipes]
MVLKEGIIGDEDLDRNHSYSPNRELVSVFKRNLKVKRGVTFMPWRRDGTTLPVQTPADLLQQDERHEQAAQTPEKTMQTIVQAAFSWFLQVPALPPLERFHNTVNANLVFCIKKQFILFSKEIPLRFHIA